MDRGRTVPTGVGVRVARRNGSPAGDPVRLADPVRVAAAAKRHRRRHRACRRVRPCGARSAGREAQRPNGRASGHVALAHPNWRNGRMTDHIIEWAAFTLRKGVSETALADASQLIQNEFLSRQEGFLRRALIRESEGRYGDLIWWSSLAAAEAALANAANSPVCARYFDLMH